MIIYRAENDDLCGPYEAYKGYYSPPWWNQDGDCHPTPSRDNLRNVVHDDRFAFLDLPQLFDWFSRRALSFMDGHGFYVVALVVDGRTIKRGGRQVTYQERHVKKRVRVADRDLERALTAYEAMWMGELGFPTKEEA